MDGVAVSGFDRWKYRAILWVREKLYERPAGMLLKEGAMPPSIQAINHLFAGRPVSIFLPYEAYTDDGLFKAYTARVKGQRIATFSFGLALTGSSRLDALEASALQESILQALPAGFVLQTLTAHLPGQEGGYTALLCCTAPAGTDRQMVLDCREGYSERLQAFGLGAAVLTPADVLAFVRQAFDVPTEEGVPYDDNELIKNQAGYAGVSLTADRMQLSTQLGVFREVALFNGRRYGWDQFFPLAPMYPALMSGGPHILSVCAQRREEGFMGTFLAAELLEPGQAPRLARIFEDGGWVIEQDRYNAHMSFLGLLPMGVTEQLAKLHGAQRRWRPFEGDQLSRILPLPYQANTVANKPRNNNVVSLEVAHAG